MGKKEVEDSSVLTYYSPLIGIYVPMFWGSLPHLSSDSPHIVNHPENGGSQAPQIVGTYVPVYKA
jgi:hypothetical protein